MEWLGYLAVVMTIILASSSIADRIERAVETKVEFVLDKWGLIDKDSEPRAMYPNGSHTLQDSLSVIYDQAKANQTALMAQGQEVLDETRAPGDER